MIRLLALFLPIVLLISCSQNSDDDQQNNSDDLVEEIIEEVIIDPNAPGDYEEFYPNGALKMKGKNNSKGKREGLWISYYDNGVKWSESYYDNGIKDGHSLTFFPNGGIRYVGEYENDIKIGLWKFYDETGEIVNEEEY